MKTIITFIFASFLLVSCVRESTATEDLMEMAPENSVLKYSGDFMQGPYGNNVNGKAEIYEKKRNVHLVLNEKFTVSNGPDLYVYVSKEQQPSQFVSLGKLKSVNGGQTYTFTVQSISMNTNTPLFIANNTIIVLLRFTGKNNITNMKNYINWALRLIPAIILLQTLFFKFTAHPDSVAIFSKLHAEPFGRIFSGVLELITAF
jgi:hypothetical protein